jgi:hypothetical protein
LTRFWFISEPLAVGIGVNKMSRYAGCPAGSGLRFRKAGKHTQEKKMRSPRIENEPFCNLPDFNKNIACRFDYFSEIGFFQRHKINPIISNL